MKTMKPKRIEYGKIQNEIDRQTARSTPSGVPVFVGPGDNPGNENARGMKTQYQYYNACSKKAQLPPVQFCGLPCDTPIILLLLILARLCTSKGAGLLSGHMYIIRISQ